MGWAGPCRGVPIARRCTSPPPPIPRTHAPAAAEKAWAESKTLYHANVHSHTCLCALCQLGRGEEVTQRGLAQALRFVLEVVWMHTVQEVIPVGEGLVWGGGWGGGWVRGWHGTRLELLAVWVAGGGGVVL